MARNIEKKSTAEGRSFDVVVLGAQVGGLIAAKLARAAGMSVLVVCSPEKVDKFSAALGVLDCEPNLFFLPPSSDPTWVKKGDLSPFDPFLVGQLTRFPLARNFGLRSEEGLDSRVTGAISENWTELQAEAERVISSSFQKMVPESGPGLAKTISTSQVVKEFRRLLKSHSREFGNPKVDSSPLASGVFSLSRIMGFDSTLLAVDTPSALPWLSALTSHSFSFQGGLRRYRAQILLDLKKAGVEIADYRQVTAVSCSRGMRQEVGFEHGPSVNCDALIIASALQDAQKIFQVRLKRPVPVNKFWFSVQLEADISAFPASLSKHLLWAEPAAPSLWIELGESEVSEKRMDRKRLCLQIRTPLNFSDVQHGPSSLTVLAKRMKHVALSLFPFLDQHLVGQSPDPATMSWTSEDVPDAAKIIDGPGIGVSAGVRNIWFCGGAALPELGILGPSVSAAVAFSQIWHRKTVRDRKAPS